MGAEQRTNVKRRFYRIVGHFEQSESRSDRPYNRPRLIRLTYEYALSEKSRANLLRAFFQAMALSMDDEGEVDYGQLSGAALFGFADYLLDNFFLPLKASAARTPQLSPAYHSAFQREQGPWEEEFGATPDRLRALRGACLVRDRHRCVVSQTFDLEEAARRLKRDGNNARDDDGKLLLEDGNSRFDVLGVAHILPHAPTRVDTFSELNPSNQAAVAILSMIDSEFEGLIGGIGIDRPRNAFFLTQSLHQLFGDFQILFEPVSEQEPDTYQIQSFCHPKLLRDPALPVTRTLHVSDDDDQNIDPPSSRLLAVHRAIAHILHLSKVGDYINVLLRDMEDKVVQADGSTELARFVTLRLVVG